MSLLQRAGAVAVLVAVAAEVGAAGFAISDKSVSSLATAFAGTAALAQDASTVYNNPAAMQQLDGRQLSIALHHITPQARYSDQGSTVTGPDPDDAGSPVLTPNLYYVSELSPRSRFGLGIYVPFALGLEYDARWPGRYHSIKSEMTTLNISPALSYQLTPTLALGAGLDVQHLTAELSQAVDFGAIINPALAGTLDGQQTLKGDHWTTGYSVGLTYAPHAQMRLGLAYHSDTRQNIHGRSEFSAVPAPLQAVFTDSAAQTHIHLPESVSLSGAWAATERLTLLADYTWTAWSRHKEFRVDFANSLPDSVTPYKWRDAGFYSLGLNYRASPQWLLRAGAAFEQTPVPDAEHRTPLGPDNDRRWYTLGFNYVATSTLSLDLALAYLAMAAAPVNTLDGAGHLLHGEYSLAGRFVSLQANWRL